MIALLIYYVVGWVFALACLCFAGICYDERDRQGCADALRAAGLLALVGPLTVVGYTVYGVYKLFRYAKDGVR